METIKIKYFNKEEEKIKKIDVGDWIDLRSSETLEIRKGEHVLIPLGVAMKLPKGYEGHLLPRSSTFKYTGLLMTNSMGVVDESYCGDNDQWLFSAYATRDTMVHKGDRICQFRIMKKQPEIEFIEVEELKDKDRNGFGSTGLK